MTIAGRPSPALKGDLVPTSPTPSRPSVAAPPSCWRPLLLVMLIGLSSSCSGDDDAAEPSTPPSAAEPSTTRLTATDPSTTQPSTTQPTVEQPSTTQLPPEQGPSTMVLGGPLDQDRSEPHIAVDPEDPDRMFVVAQGALPYVSLDPQLFWRTDNGGQTWSEPLVMGFIDNTVAGAAGDPVVAAGTDGLVLFATLAVMIEGDPETLTDDLGTFTGHIGTRVSTDQGRTFSSFGTADRLVITGPTSEEIDKEWLAIDNSDGPFRGSAYLAWIHFRPDDTQDVLFAWSRDGGNTYSTPLVLEHIVAGRTGGVEENVQIAVRPDGTVDAVWNSNRDGQPVVLHTSSTDGGATFSTSTPIARHDADTSIGMVLSLAVSPQGRLGLCWPQPRPGPAFLPQVLCQQTDAQGRWRDAEALLPGDEDRQYLPAATFRDETLWVATYVSDTTTTRVLAVPYGQHGFDPPATLIEWPVPSDRICAPHPPDCTDGQTFIGDYIGAVATPRQVVVAAIEPVVDGGYNNAVVLRLPLHDST